MKVFDAAKNVFKYKIFDDSTEFEQWQRDKDVTGNNISSIIPIPRTFAIDKTEAQEISTCFGGILVVYWE